jgi:hypothetical protein
MSNKCISATLEKSQSRGYRRLLLLVIADRADDCHRAWPGLTDLQNRTLMCRQAVLDSLNALEQAGELFIDRRRHGGNRYLVLVGLDDAAIIETLGSDKFGMDLEEIHDALEQIRLNKSTGQTRKKRSNKSMRQTPNKSIGQTTDEAENKSMRQTRRVYAVDSISLSDRPDPTLTLIEPSDSSIPSGIDTATGEEANDPATTSRESGLPPEEPPTPPVPLPDDPPAPPEQQPDDPPKKLTDQQLLFGEICTAFGYDIGGLDKEDEKDLGKTVSRLKKKGAAPGEIAALYRWLKEVHGPSLGFANFTHHAMPKYYKDFLVAQKAAPEPTDGTIDLRSPEWSGVPICVVRAETLEEKMDRAKRVREQLMGESHGR